MMESLIPEWSVAGYRRERTGPILPNVAPSNVYPTADGSDVLIAANQDTVFRRLSDVMERPGLPADPRYATHGARGENQAELDDIISAWTRTVPSAKLLSLLHEAGVPAGGIYTAADIIADPHVQARQAVIEVDHPDFGRIPMQNVAPRLSGTPGEVKWAGPALGASNEEIYQGLLGLSADEVSDLKTRGIV
jgi:formyl-CoA transferase